MVNNPYTMPGFGDSYDHEYDKREARDAAVTARAEEIHERWLGEASTLFCALPPRVVSAIDTALWDFAVEEAEKEIPH